MHGAFRLPLQPWVKVEHFRSAPRASYPLLGSLQCFEMQKSSARLMEPIWKKGSFTACRFQVTRKRRSPLGHILYLCRHWRNIPRIRCIVSTPKHLQMEGKDEQCQKLRIALRPHVPIALEGMELFCRRMDCIGGETTQTRLLCPKRRGGGGNWGEEHFRKLKPPILWVPP